MPASRRRYSRRAVGATKDQSRSRSFGGVAVVRTVDPGFSRGYPSSTNSGSPLSAGERADRAKLSFARSSGLTRRGPIRKPPAQSWGLRFLRRLRRRTKTICRYDALRRRTASVCSAATSQRNCAARSTPAAASCARSAASVSTRSICASSARESRGGK